MTIKVYQIQDELMHKSEGNSLFFDIKISGGFEKIEHCLKSNYYKLVAEVDTEDLEKAFELTNSIDNYWGENAGVTDLTNGSRSTSTGDLMYDGKKLSIVKSFGFEELPSNLIEILPTKVVSKKPKNN